MRSWQLSEDTSQFESILPRWNYKAITTLHPDWRVGWRNQQQLGPNKKGSVSLVTPSLEFQGDWRHCLQGTQPQHKTDEPLRWPDTGEQLGVIELLRLWNMILVLAEWSIQKELIATVRLDEPSPKWFARNHGMRETTEDT